jgi:geranylgeranyl pyrophosphate synthase
MDARFLAEVEQKALPAVEGRLETFFAAQKARGIAFNVEMSRYHYSTGGKRLRALIPAWIFASHGADALDPRAATLGCALELVHNATLVHDDLQDGDVMRRGQPTVWKKHSAAQAICCGDALFQFAFEMLDGLEVPAERWRAIHSRMTRATLQVIEGQSQEFLMKEENFPGYERYLGVVRGKTAALFACAVACSLEALGRSAEECSLAEAHALEAGVAFQLQDDVLDIYGDKGRETRATDIAEGKISALVARVYDVATQDERASVERVLRKPRAETTSTDIEGVLRLFERYRARETATDAIRSSRERLARDPALAHFAETRGFLLELSSRFLAPIAHLY